MVHNPPNLPPSNDGPLHGVNIVDLTTVVMGPYATQILGDLGADVITIEQPTGDPCRAMGPGPGAGMSGVALNLMRNKRSAVLDIGNVSDRPTIEGLLRWAHVFVTNLRPEPLRRAHNATNQPVAHLLPSSGLGH
jgi:crotonobetainyl-CoA:carnitine CoA-transferase CaiB-like acyl-CoA transferase